MDAVTPRIALNATNTKGNCAASSLCDLCGWMLSNWHKYEENNDFHFPHHVYFDELEKAAMEGCALCYQFAQSELYHGDKNDPKDGYTIWNLGVYVQTNEEAGAEGTSEEPSFRLALDVLPRSKRPPAAGDELVNEIVYCEVSMFPARYPRLSHTNTIDALDRAAWWLKQCQTSHAQCNNCSDQWALPTRLLVLDNGPVRLCLGTGIPKSSQYATLSHCWGSLRYNTLTKENLETFIVQVPCDTLSQTVNDAIIVARYMGFSYLWIDTLCIVQDDAEDWRHESSLMYTVYGGSSLNIAASSAGDGSGGCFFDRSDVWRCQATVQTAGTTLHYEFSSRSLVEEGLGATPLLHRGWVLQERILAPRTLHFTKTQLFWECCNLSACETFPDGIPSAIDCYQTLRKAPLEPSMWPWIVEQYSLCQLTYTADKLIAISGIARQIHQHNREQYVAGMWRTGLEIQLCWGAQTPAPCRANATYVAPSWSWASLDWDVVYPRPKVSYDTCGKGQFWSTVSNIDVQYVGHDSFGAISSAKLHMRCSMLLKVGVLTLHAGSDTGRMIFQFGDKEIESEICRDIEWSKEGDLTPDSQPQDEVYALPIVAGLDRSHLRGLLLKPTKSRHGIYQRFGVFIIGYNGNVDVCSDFIEAAALYPYMVNEEDCFKVETRDDGEVEYIIELV